MKDRNTIRAERQAKRVYAFSALLLYIAFFAFFGYLVFLKFPVAGIVMWVASFLVVCLFVAFIVLALRDEQK